MSVSHLEKAAGLEDDGDSRKVPGSLWGGKDHSLIGEKFQEIPKGEWELGGNAQKHISEGLFGSLR